MSTIYYYQSNKVDVSSVFVSGALMCMMLLVPVYCYEHHLSLLLLPVTICIVEAEKIGFKYSVFAWLALAIGGMPLFILRWIQRQVPILDYPLQESKFAFILVLMVFCLWAAKNQES